MLLFFATYFNHVQKYEGFFLKFWSNSGFLAIYIYIASQKRLGRGGLGCQWRGPGPETPQMKMGHILFTYIRPPKGFSTCWTALYKSILNNKGANSAIYVAWFSSRNRPPKGCSRTLHGFECNLRQGMDPQVGDSAVFMATRLTVMGFIQGRIAPQTWPQRAHSLLQYMIIT